MERYLRKSLSHLYRWILMALAETALVTPWLILLYRVADAQVWARALPGAWLLIATFLGGALWETGRPKSEGGKSQEFRSRLAGMLAGSALFYLLAYLALPAELQTGLLHVNMALAALPAIWYLWYQAAESVVAGLEYGRVFGRFTGQATGMAAGVILVLMGGLAHEPRIQVMLYWDVYLLFGAGLTQLLVARERALRRKQAALGEEGAGGALPSRRLTILVGLLLGLTLLASQIVSPDQLAGWVTAGWWLLRGPVEWLLDVSLLLMVRLAAMLYAVVHFLWGIIARHVHPRPPINQEPQPPKDPLPVELYKDLQGADWIPYLKAGALLLAGALVLLGLYRLQRRRREALSGELGEERISLGFWSLLWADLRLWLSRLRRRPPAPDSAAAVEAALAPDPRDPRALFRRLQGWGQSHGRGRKRSETPNQYCAALAAALPEAGPGAEAVTAVYNQARYGPQPPAPEEVAFAAAALDELQKRPYSRSSP